MVFSYLDYELHAGKIAIMLIEFADPYVKWILLALVLIVLFFIIRERKRKISLENICRKFGFKCESRQVNVNDIFGNFEVFRRSKSNNNAIKNTITGVFNNAPFILFDYSWATRRHSQHDVMETFIAFKNAVGDKNIEINRRKDKFRVWLSETHGNWTVISRTAEFGDSRVKPNGIIEFLNSAFTEIEK